MAEGLGRRIAAAALTVMTVACGCAIKTGFRSSRMEFLATTNRVVVAPVLISLDEEVHGILDDATAWHARSIVDQEVRSRLAAYGYLVESSGEKDDRFAQELARRGGGTSRRGHPEGLSRSQWRDAIIASVQAPSVERPADAVILVTIALRMGTLNGWTTEWNGGTEHCSERTINAALQGKIQVYGSGFGASIVIEILSAGQSSHRTWFGSALIAPLPEVDGRMFDHRAAIADEAGVRRAVSEAMAPLDRTSPDTSREPSPDDRPAVH